MLRGHHGRRLLSAGNGFATFDPENKDINVTLSNNNLTASYNVTLDRSAYLTKQFLTGRYACEITFTANGNNTLPSPLFVYEAGFGNLPNNTVDVPGNYSNSVSMQQGTGGHFINGVMTGSFWDAVSGVGSVALLVFDFDARQVGSVESGVLKMSQAVIGTDALFMSFGFFNNTGILGSIDIMTGQSAFTAANEAILVADEIATGNPIIRGIF